MLQRRELMHTGESMKDALNLDTKLGFEPMPQYVFLKKMLRCTFTGNWGLVYYYK